MAPFFRHPVHCQQHAQRRAHLNPCLAFKFQPSSVRGLAASFMDDPPPLLTVLIYRHWLRCKKIQKIQRKLSRYLHNFLFQTVSGFSYISINVDKSQNGTVNYKVIKVFIYLLFCTKFGSGLRFQDHCVEDAISPVWQILYQSVHGFWFYREFEIRHPPLTKPVTVNAALPSFFCQREPLYSKTNFLPQSTFIFVFHSHV